MLGVSDKWMKQFETIGLQAPDWYQSSDHFSMDHFRSFMNQTMNSAQSVMTAQPSSKSSSSSIGSSGGGSSGGGSGGGGGGSW